MKLFELKDNPLTELLNEEAVISSWIADLSYDEDTNSAWMTTSTGSSYEIPGMDYEDYKAWLDSDSKGKWWWSDIKGIFTV